MFELNLPEFSINFSSANDDILKLIKIIKPEWNESDMEIKSMPGGYSCSMYKVTSKINPKDAVTIRVCKVFAELTLPIMSKAFERKIVQVLSKLDLFPVVYAMFKNGYCYQYVEGQSFFDLTTDLTEERKSFDYENFPFHLIAKCLAKIHSLKVDDQDYSKCLLFPKVLDMVDNQYPDTPNALLVDKPTLRKEIIKLTEYSKNFNLKISLCHGDPHLGNFIWNKETDEVAVIDWEMASIGYQALDIAHFLATVTESEFLEISGYSNIDEDVADKIKKKFIGLYVVEYSKVNDFELTDEYLAELERHVKFFEMVFCLAMTAFMGSILPEVAKSPKFPRIAKFGVKHFERYLLNKDKVFADLQLNKPGVNFCFE